MLLFDSEFLPPCPCLTCLKNWHVPFNFVLVFREVCQIFFFVFVYNRRTQTYFQVTSLVSSVSRLLYQRTIHGCKFLQGKP